jgi:nicotinamidase/pyrazinamidase
MLILGVQNDHCPGGARPVRRGERVVGPSSFLASAVDHAGGLIVVVREWHSPQSAYFDPAHPAFCIAGTPGASFHPDLQLTSKARQVFRSSDPQELGPSAFRGIDRAGRPLLALLREQGVEHLFLAGSTVEEGIRATALDALRMGFSVSVVFDAVAAIDERRGGDVLSELRNAGAEVVSSGQAIMHLYSSGEARL